MHNISYSFIPTSKPPKALLLFPIYFSKHHSRSGRGEKNNNGRKTGGEAGFSLSLASNFFMLGVWNPPLL
jgi:hypothetical protein